MKYKNALLVVKYINSNQEESETFLSFGLERSERVDNKMIEFLQSLTQFDATINLTFPPNRQGVFFKSFISFKVSKNQDKYLVSELYKNNFQQYVLDSVESLYDKLYGSMSDLYHSHIHHSA